MNNTATRVPAFAPYMERDKNEIFDVDRTSSRNKEIDRLLSESVECWIAGDLDEAIQSTKMAERFLIMTDEEFSTENEEEGK